MESETRDSRMTLKMQLRHRLVCACAPLAIKSVCVCVCCNNGQLAWINHYFSCAFQASAALATPPSRPETSTSGKLPKDFRQESQPRRVMCLGRPTGYIRQNSSKRSLPYSESLKICANPPKFNSWSMFNFVEWMYIILYRSHDEWKDNLIVVIKCI